MRIDKLTSAEQVEAIAPEWDQLWRGDPNATPFQAPQWLLPWWRCFGSGTLLVHTLRNAAGALQALAPLCLLRDEEEDQSLGLLLGTGVSDYLDILSRPGVDLAPLAEAIGGSDCALFDFHQLRPSSPLLALEPPVGWSDQVEEHEPCPVIDLDSTLFEGTRLSTHFRKKLRYERRRLEREGGLSFDRPSPASLDAFLEILFQLHASRWKQRGLPGVLSDPAAQAFHREAARRMLDAGALRMYAMRAGDRLAAIFYGFAHHHTVYYYLGGFDPVLEKLSPGTVVVAHAIEQAARSGAAAFDFLRGAEGYKYAWGAANRVTRRRQWFRG
ncbi:MAG TPA: GNAT family N-acetyltransferase [Thermoanaerobaculia bacterium]|nr:GNAT family N-acetyltransferase [Thermoanaerobaculia bacterium]